MYPLIVLFFTLKIFASGKNNFADGEPFNLEKTRWTTFKMERLYAPQKFYLVENKTQQLKGVLVEEFYDLQNGKTLKSFQSSHCQMLAKTTNKKVMKRVDGEQCWLVGPGLNSKKELVILISRLKNNIVYYRNLQFEIEDGKEILESHYQDLIGALKVGIK